MKRKKTLIILLILLLVAIAAIFIEKAINRHIDTINTIDEEVFAIDADDLSQVTIEYNNKTLTFSYSDDTWTYDDNTDFPIDQDYMSDLIAHFESVHASFIIEDVEDYGQYGLSSPEATLTFTTSDGDKEISFGSFSTMDEKRYICVDGGNVYLIDEDILEYVTSDIDEYLDRDEVYDYSQITSLKVTGDGEANVVYDPDGSYTYTDDYDYYYVEGSDYQPVSEDAITSFISSLSSMDLTQYVSYTVNDSILADYGLNNPTLTVEVTGEVPSDDEDAEDGAVESKTQTIYFTLDEDEDLAYVYFDGSAIVYAITSDEYNELAEVSYATLRPEEVVSIDWTNVSQMSVTIDGKKTVIDVDASGDGNKYTIDGEEVDFVTVTSKIDSLTLTEVGEDYDASDEELTFAITLNDEDATSIRVTLYQYDGDSCVVDVDGKTVGLCSRSSMSTLREEITSAILNKGKTDEDNSEGE